MKDEYKKKEVFVNRNKIVFLVWDRNGIRAHGISKHIGAALYFLSTSRIRHPLLYVKTLQILKREKPQIIICQSPPITCAFIAMVYKHLFAGMSKPKILIDVHTGAISRPWSKNVSKLIMKHASANIVINEEQQNYLIRNYQIKSVVLEDPIPDLTEILSSTEKNQKYKMEHKAAFNVVVVSTFAYDEPLQEVFDAASELPDVNFYVTGDKKNADKNLSIKKLDNIIMTGFLDYDTYVDLLQKVDVIMDLTTDSKSMVAGAYEAVALGRPLITSDWIPLKRYFNKGTVYVNNSSDEIRQAITLVMTKKEQLTKEIHQLKILRTKEWKAKLSSFDYLFR
jgi:Glycosyl transferases group 1